MSMSLQTALVAETYVADGLTLKLRSTINVKKSVVIILGIRILTVSNMEEQLILLLNALIRIGHHDDAAWNKMLNIKSSYNTLYIQYLIATYTQKICYSIRQKTSFELFRVWTNSSMKQSSRKQMLIPIRIVQRWCTKRRCCEGWRRKT
jgi:hypothetical protein